MQLHFYRVPLVWQRGVGLCRADNILEMIPGLHAMLIARGLATFVQSCGEPMICDATTQLVQLTPPEDEPVSLAEAKQFLRIEHTADDAVITRAIAAAREAAEQYLRLVFLPQEWKFTTGTPNHSVLRLPVGPAQGITSVAAIDDEGEETALDEDAYRLTLDGFGVIFETLPTMERLAVTFEAALATDVAGVPALIKQGLLHHVAAMLAQREGFVPMPISAISCYQPYRRIAL